MNSNYPRPTPDPRLTAPSYGLALAGAVAGWIGIGWTMVVLSTEGAYGRGRPGIDVMTFETGITLGHVFSLPGLLGAATMLTVRGSLALFVGMGVSVVHFLLGLALLWVTLKAGGADFALTVGLFYIAGSWIWAIPVRRWLERYRTKAPQ